MTDGEGVETGDADDMERAVEEEEEVTDIGLKAEEPTAQSGIGGLRGREGGLGVLQDTAAGAAEGEARMWALSMLEGTLVEPENLIRWFGRLPGHETERCSSQSEGKGSEVVSEMVSSSSSSSEGSSQADSIACSNSRGSFISESSSSWLADWRSVAVEVDVRVGL